MSNTNNNNSLESSWHLCGDSLNSNEMSIISTGDMTESTVDVELNDSQISANEISSTSNLKQEKQEFEIHDSYDLKINDVLSVLSQKTSNKLEQIVKKPSQLTNQIPKKSAFIEKLKDSKQNNEMNQTLQILEQKKKNLIELAKDSDQNPKNLNEKAKELHQMKQSIAFSAAVDDIASLLKDTENLNYKVDLLKQNHTIIPAKIVQPIHDEPKIDLNSLLSANQTEAQFMISKVKDKNKNFMEAIFDD